MADEHNPSPAEEITAQPPPADASANGAVTEQAAPPPPTPAEAPVPDRVGDYSFKRSWGQLILGWIMAIITFFVVAVIIDTVFGFLVVAVTGDVRWASLLGFVSAIITYALFWKLDENLWLSRLFGLQTGPHSSPLRTVLYYLTFGLAGFFHGRDRERLARIYPGLKRATADTATGPDSPPRPKEGPPRPHDVTREIAETVVFVVVLVLMLKTFIAEAFVIPTGSMATTLWGYQKVVDCPQCGFRFPVNCSSESDPQSDTRPTPVVGCTCPNCRLGIDFTGVDEGPLLVAEPEPDVLFFQSSSGRDPLLLAEFGQDSGGRLVPWDNIPERERGQFRKVPVRICKLTAQTRITLDGQEVSLDKFKEALRGQREPLQCRVRYQLSVSDKLAQPLLDLEASASGKFTKKFEAFNPAPNSGDRVLVAKFLYDSGLHPPQRQDVVVFKYPETPQKNYVALNYIKRLVGRPGETIGIHAGNLYYTRAFQYEPPPGVRPEELREERFTHRNDEKALELLKEAVRKGGSDPEKEFVIVRKAPEVILALRRIVYDNDHPAKDLAAAKLPPRWDGAGPWKAGDDGKEFAHEGGNDTAWLRYRHLVPAADRKSVKAMLITDFSGYNSNRPPRGGEPGQNWASDLMLECDVQVDGSAGELALELSKGVDRFQACFDLATGECKLVRIQGTLQGDGKGALRDEKETVLETKPTKLKSGKHHLRFANFDQRLTLWVDDDLPFGDGVAYDPPRQAGPTEENDLQRPAGVGARGATVKVSALTVWRDTYYTAPQTPQASSAADVDLSAEAWGDPSAWKPLRDNDKYRTMYVQPGHYLCMGDNSPESSDGRSWGLVPDRLMLGRALIVYYPFKWTVTWPHNPENRVGPIH